MLLCALASVRVSRCYSRSREDDSPRVRGFYRQSVFAEIGSVARSQWFPLPHIFVTYRDFQSQIGESSRRDPPSQFLAVSPRLPDEELIDSCDPRNHGLFSAASRRFTLVIATCKRLGIRTIDALKRTTWNFFSGTQLTFGPGAVGALSSVIQRRGARRVLLVSDRVLVENGLIARVEKAIRQTQSELELFTDGEVEPSTATVAKLAAVAGDFGPDVIVAVGGGSNMDLAKAGAAAFANGESVETLVGFDNVPGPTPTLICLPTTAGTGSEVSHAAILKNSVTGKKDTILSQRIRPDVAIVDPQLTYSCPANVTAESGIDALTNAIEAFLVTNFYSFSEDLEHGLPYEGNHPLGDLYSEKAIALIGKNLQHAVDEPENLAARSGMSLAATLAGAAFSSCGVSLCHAFEYAIGSTYHCSHGAGNGIMLPEVMRFWRNSRQARLAKIAGLLGVPDAARMPEQDSADAAIDAVEYLRKSVGLPCSLSEVGGKAEHIDELARTAMSLQRLVDLSPVTPNIEDAKRILKTSL